MSLLKQTATNDEWCFNILHRFQMDERSPYARPLKLANASRNEKFKFKSKKTIDDVQEDINEALEGEAAPPKVSLHDQHLTPAQLSRRFPS